MGIYVRQLALGPMQNFVYLVGPEDSPDTAVIDPAWDVDAILEAARADGRRITHALVTHRHFDHTNGLVPLLEKQPVQIIAHREDADHLAGDIPASEVTRVAGGDLIEVGSLPIRTIHTPGHTPGSQCFLVQFNGGALVSGDTVFVNGCGRCDFQDSDPVLMFDSLHRVLGALPGETALYPGHDYGDVKVSSLARERENNPYFRLHDRDAFVSFRMRPRT